MTDALLGVFEPVSIERDADSLRATLRVPGPEHAVFEGHFEGAPLLPAWVQLAVVQHFAEGLLGALSGVRGVRFRGAALPHDTLELVVTGGRFELTSPNGPVAGGRLVRGA